MLKTKRGGIVGGIVSGRIKAAKYDGGGNIGGGCHYSPMTAEELEELRARYGGIWTAAEASPILAAAYIEERRADYLNGGGGFLETARRAYETDAASCILCGMETDGGADICYFCELEELEALEGMEE